MQQIKFKLFLVLVTLLTLSACQKNNIEKIYGEWKLENVEVVNAKEVIEKSKQNQNELLRVSTQEQLNKIAERYYAKGIIMSFMQDSIFSLGGLQGKWSYDEKQNSLNVHFTSLDKTNFQIEQITNKKLVLSDIKNLGDIPFKIKLTFLRVENK